MDAHVSFLYQICCRETADGDMIFCIPGLAFLGENYITRIFVLNKDTNVMICRYISVVYIVDPYI